jgi:Tfp pilus assembly protein PilP
MKKLLALVLALLMLATVLVACGDGETESENLKDYLQNEEMADYVTLESGEKML